MKSPRNIYYGQRDWSIHSTSEIIGGFVEHYWRGNGLLCPLPHTHSDEELPDHTGVHPSQTNWLS